MSFVEAEAKYRPQELAEWMRPQRVRHADDGAAGRSYIHRTKGVC